MIFKIPKEIIKSLSAVAFFTHWKDVKEFKEKNKENLNETRNTPLKKNNQISQEKKTLLFMSKKIKKKENCNKTTNVWI